MLIAWIANALALAFGALLGARALLDPRWAQRFVRLQPDEQGGGFAEFRATYGGVFLFSHGLALLLSLMTIGGEYVIGVAATGASAVLSAAWAGSCCGRSIAIWRDNADTRFNRVSAAVEAGLALAIGAPWIVWILGASPQ